jgi:two-component system chemotaxis response regulator CheB
MENRVRVLVTDDSAFMRKMISEILSQDPAIEVIGTARDGADAVAKVLSLKPQVVTLDVEMPVMDGFAALTRIMKEQPTPVVMISSLTQAGAEATIRCLGAGAVDFVGKPSGSISLDIEKVGQEIAVKVKMAARVRMATQAPAAPPKPFIPSPRVPVPGGATPFPRVLVIGSSTGGPRALQSLMPALPGDLDVPIAVVQHMPSGFTAALAKRLNEACEYEVREAADGDLLRAGLALVAPGGKHLEFGIDGRARLTVAPPVHNVRPSVDVTVASLVQAYGGRMMAVLLTGMGDDGARGLKAVRGLGGITFAEDSSTCVVYGMPRSAVEMDAVDHLLPLHAMAPAIVEAVRGCTNPRATRIPSLTSK